jgi:hypothetical protein
MDFAITPAGHQSGCGAECWDVLFLTRQRGAEVAARLASFGYRQHAEAFLADLLEGGKPARHETVS